VETPSADARARTSWRVGQFLLFDVGALPYAFLTAQPTWRTHGAQLAELCGVASGDKLLDVGCGPGESAFGMAESVPGLDVTGLDYSASMIRIAQFRRRRDRTARGVRGAESPESLVTFVRGDAMNLPFTDGSFDAVTGHSFLYLVPSAEQVLREAKRVLRPGKLCAFLEPRWVPDWPLRPSGLRAQAASNPRFVSSIALWRIVSRRYGRWDESRFARVFEAAGLEPVEARPTLEGLGFLLVGRRPLLRSVSDVDWARWTPKDRATLLFVVDGDRVLLIEKKRGLGAGKVNAPGGRTEGTESIRECAIREVEEELRVTPTGVEEMGELRFQFQDGYALHATVFRASGLVGTPTETAEAKPLWVTKDTIPFDRMWADDRLWIPKMLAGEPFSGRFVFDGDTMVDHVLEGRRTG
jgi:8-oxo-dGTP diphosphatase